MWRVASKRGDLKVVTTPVTYGPGHSVATVGPWGAVQVCGCFPTECPGMEESGRPAAIATAIPYTPHTTHTHHGMAQMVVVEEWGGAFSGRLTRHGFSKSPPPLLRRWCIPGLRGIAPDASPSRPQKKASARRPSQHHQYRRGLYPFGTARDREDGRAMPCASRCGSRRERHRSVTLRKFAQGLSGLRPATLNSQGTVRV